VTGCLGTHPDRIRARHPKVLAITGPHATEAVLAAVNTHLPQPHDPHIDLLPPQGVRLTPRHYAYLKISEGCNNKCSFCIIPSLRGLLDSRPLDEVLREAEMLVRSGVRELLVISQDTSAYGSDLRYRQVEWRGRTVDTRFIDLARELGELGVWVRLHYVYPYPHVDEVMPLMAQGKILPYLDIPFQHANPRILKLMKRPAASAKTLERIRAWRKVCPELTIRSTFIVGFPGETEAEFDELLGFLHEAQLDRVGAFAYSPVDGAKANALPDPVDEDVKQDRLERFMKTQAKISAARLKRKIGTTLKALVDRVDADGAVARTSADAPEIDGVLRIRDGQKLKPGQFVDVRIEATDEHDLVGALAG
jgi:ribosomal protein S12 methylthiotransferase